MSKELYEYRVTLTESQMRLVIAAMDLCSRIELGQLLEVLDWLPVGENGTPVDRFAARADLDTFRAKHLSFRPGEAHGIHSPLVKDSARQAFDIKQVLRYVRAHHRKKPGEKTHYTVDFDQPRQTSTDPDLVMPLCEALTPVEQFMESSKGGG